MLAPDIEELMSIVPPPKTPIANKGDWISIEADLGLQLSDDYKQFISIYGAGTISGMVSVGNPFIQPVSARRFWENWVDIYRDIAANGTDVPYDLYPAKSGLLPVANYADFNIINWLVGNDANEADLVFYTRSDGFFNLGHITMTRFIIQLLTGATALPKRVASSDLFCRSPIEFRSGATFG
jgi:hypothetical protein